MTFETFSYWFAILGLIWLGIGAITGIIFIYKEKTSDNGILDCILMIILMALTGVIGSCAYGSEWIGEAREKSEKKRLDNTVPVR